MLAGSAQIRIAQQSIRSSGVEVDRSKRNRPSDEGQHDSFFEDQTGFGNDGEGRGAKKSAVRVKSSTAIRNGIEYITRIGQGAVRTSPPFSGGATSPHKQAACISVWMLDVSRPLMLFRVESYTNALCRAV